MLYTHSCCFKSWTTKLGMLPQSGARGWYREPTKLLRPSSFIGSRLSKRNRFPGDFNLSVVPVFRCGGTLTGASAPYLDVEISSTVSCDTRELFSCSVGIR